MNVKGPPPLHVKRRLRVGQIYRQRNVTPERLVEIVHLDHEAGDVYIRRIPPCAENVLGRRTVRRLADFGYRFEFVYEVEARTHCSKCGSPIRDRHYPETTHSEYQSSNGECWTCHFGKPKKQT
jgi:uncharacterized protein with PIN domain